MYSPCSLPTTFGIETTEACLFGRNFPSKTSSKQFWIGLTTKTSLRSSTEFAEEDSELNEEDNKLISELLDINNLIFKKRIRNSAVKHLLVYLTSQSKFTNHHLTVSAVYQQRQLQKQTSIHPMDFCMYHSSEAKK